MLPSALRNQIGPFAYPERAEAGKRRSGSGKVLASVLGLGESPLCSLIEKSGAQFNRKKIAPKMEPKPNFEKHTCMNCHLRNF